MIQAKGISLRYQDGTVALKDINLDIKPGELVYITGPSGSGKTSLLKLLMGMEYPTTGILNVLDQPIKHGEASHIRIMRQEIGPVFQEFKLIEGRTALENVMMGMRFLKIPSRKIKEYAVNALRRVNLDDKINTPVENLSWGQSQRVAIARAVARKPSLIIADEPTGNLDHDNAMNILNLLHSFQDNKTTVIITTHATHLIEHVKNATFIEVDEGNITIKVKGERIR